MKNILDSEQTGKMQTWQNESGAIFPQLSEHHLIEREQAGAFSTESSGLLPHLRQKNDV